MKWLLWLLGFFASFSVSAQNNVRHTVLIHELFPDPSPSRGLPNAEFIELKNVSASDIQLRNWRVSNGSTSGKISSNFILKPDSIVILVSSAAIAAYQVYGTCLVLSPFPARNDEEDTLILFNDKDSLVHAIAYNTSWYRNPVKQDGGWSLEMIDASQPCLQSMNWIASIAPSGGTPGKPNQSAGPVQDSTAPWIARAYMVDSLNIRMVMNEPMNKSVVAFSPPLDIAQQYWVPPLFQELSIRLRQELPKDSLLLLQLTNLADCSGNAAPVSYATIGRFANLINEQCIINEILFDPPTGGSDYIELYNRSSQPIDIAQLMLAGRTANGSLSQPRPITSSPYPLLPNQYLVVTEDTSWVHSYYSPGQILMVETDLPILPDDEGTVVVLHAQGGIVDELRYSAEWHFPLMSNRQGVSLERVSPMGATQEAQNWHSAASTTRFGTPGLRNAQSVPFTLPSDDVLTASASIISPNQDGFQDIIRLKYELDKPGYLANIHVYSLWGAIAHTIANNQLCGVEGEFVWNGQNLQQVPLKKGTYVIHARFHHPNGQVKQKKIAIGVW